MESNIDKIDKIVELTEKKTELLKELKESLKEESADYIVDIPDGDPIMKTYLLIRKSDRTTIFNHRDKSKVRQFIERRKLKVHWRVD